MGSLMKRKDSPPLDKENALCGKSRENLKIRLQPQDIGLHEQVPGGLSQYPTTCVVQAS